MTDLVYTFFIKDAYFKGISFLSCLRIDKAVECDFKGLQIYESIWEGISDINDAIELYLSRCPAGEHDVR